MLRPGDRFLRDGYEYRVVYVNDSRVHCTRTEVKNVTVYDARRGGLRHFTTRVLKGLDISPDSQVDVLRT